MTFYLPILQPLLLSSVINLKYILKQSNIYFVRGQNKYIFFVFYKIVE